MLKETIYSIIQWQKETFPDATLEGQIAKFSEEHNEFRASFNKGKYDTMELADMFIVACGIARFDMLEGILRIWNTLNTSLYFKVQWKDLFEAVDAKMEINRNRSWNKKGGLYKHKKD